MDKREQELLRQAMDFINSVSEEVDSALHYTTVAKATVGGYDNQLNQIHDHLAAVARITSDIYYSMRQQQDTLFGRNI